MDSVNCTVHDGLVYAVSQVGYLSCLDARTGQHYWTHDLRTGVWGTPLLVDGKVYVPTEDGDVRILAHGQQKKELNTVEMEQSFHCSPVFANGVLYLMSEQTLYAVQEKK